jgi:hypothetical protein
MFVHILSAWRLGRGGYAQARVEQKGRGEHMALARTWAVALSGVAGQWVAVEADLANGLPGATVIGLGDVAVTQARDWMGGRIRCGARYPSLMALRSAGRRSAVVPVGNLGEACLADGVTVRGVASLADLIAFLNGERDRLVDAPPRVMPVSCRRRTWWTCWASRRRGGRWSWQRPGVITSR